MNLAISNLISSVMPGNSPAFLASIGSVFQFVGQWFNNAILWVISAVLKLIWNIVRLMLTSLDFMQFVAKSFLGMDTSPDSFLNVIKDPDQIQLVNVITKTFRAILILSIVLLIIFTIVALIRQEYKNATENFEKVGKDKKAKVGNDKKGIIMNMLKSILSMLLLPLVMVFIVIGVNAALTSFDRAFNATNGASIGSQVLASSTFNANRYRKYANNNIRIPITIEAYASDEYDTDQSYDLAYRIKSASVQSTLRKNADALAYNDFISFSNSLTYKNNKLVNSSNYGGIYENFVCTAEQYQVLADFIDYAEMYGLTYYIKAMDEKDINWKYVDTANFNENDKSLTIKYRDASDLNGNGNTKDSYEITYKMSYDVTSPISDALKSILAMLGIGEYSDYKYKVMERDENYLNLVKWSGEKVLIKLSDGFDLENPNTWTVSDQIIIYEYNHFSHNNTFEGKSIADLKNGVELDAMEITYREFYASANAYSPERTITGVYINGNYYHTEKSKTVRDSYGEFYYVLKAQDFSFLEQEYTTISKIDRDVTLKTSDNFNINKPGKWTYVDEILIYEYYNDYLSYLNTFSGIPFSAFNNEGVQVPVYKIETSDFNGNVISGRDNYYTLINGTYYKVTENGSGFALASGSSDNDHFMINSESSADIVYTYKLYNIDSINQNVTGIGGSIPTSSLIYKGTNPIEIELSATDVKNYGNFILKFSSNFNYQDVDTWTYRDYFLFYIYSMFNSVAGSLEELKNVGLNGEICKVAYNAGNSNNLVAINGQSVTEDKVVFKFLVTNSNGNLEYRYLDIQKVMNISELKMLKRIQQSASINNNNLSDIFVPYNYAENNLLTSEVDYKNFNFSYDFNRNDLSTWTVNDLLLLYFVDNNVIGEMNTILANGYNSVVYKLNSDENTILYKFGKGENAIFLNENNVLNLTDISGKKLVSNIDEWLDLKLINLVGKLYGISSNELFSDNDNIINSIFSEYRQNVKSLNQIINILLNDNGLLIDKGDVVKDYAEIGKYTYQNIGFNFSNLSTWTVLDAAIYYLTGSASGEYTSNVLSFENENYFVIGNRAINISSGNFASTIADNNIITSNVTGIARNSGDDYKQILESNYADLVISESKFLNASGENTLSRYLNTEFEYTLKNTGNYEILELVLRAYKTNLNNTENFTIYTDGEDEYLRIVGDNETVYVKANETGLFADISYLQNSTLTLNNSSLIFESLSNYNYLDNFDEDLSNLKISYLDAIIYYLTDSTNKATYNIYSFTSAFAGLSNNKFICLKVNNNYIFVLVNDNDIIKKSITDLSTDITNQLSSNSDLNMNDFVNFLYDNFYTSLDIIPSDIVNSGAELSVTYYSNFNLNDISTWTPLNVILYKNGAIAGNNTNTLVQGNLVASGNGRNYLHIYVNISEIYIEIDDLATLNNNVVNDASFENAMLFVNLMLAKYSTTNISEFINSNYLTFNNTINDAFEISNNTSNVNDLVLTIDTIDGVYDFKDYSWFDLLYNKYTSEFRRVTDFNVYTDANGVNYIKINITDNSYKFVAINNLLFSSANNGIENYNFDINSTNGFTALDLIASYYTGNNIGQINYFRLKTGDNTFTDKIYYIQDATTEEYYLIYGISDEKAVNSSSNPFYITTADSDIFNWNALDVIIKVSSNDTNSQTVQAIIYTIGGVQYLSTNSQFINISKFMSTVSVETFRNAYDSLPKILTRGEGSANNIFNTFRDSSLIKRSERSVTADDTINTLGENKFVKFSENFKADDVSTWTLSDLLIYSYFENGYFVDEYGNTITNFQKLVNAGGVKASIKNYVYEDEFGNATIKKVVLFGNTENTLNSNNQYIEIILLDNFKPLLIREASNIVLTKDTGINITLEINKLSNGESDNADSNNSNVQTLKIKIPIEFVSSSFEYKNYYFLIVNNVNLASSNLLLSGALYDSIISSLVNGNISSNDKIVLDGLFNLKLSDDFDVDDIDTWTVLDFIVLYESTRATVDDSNNLSGKTVKELKDRNNIIDCISFVDTNYKILYINGNCYNLTDFVEENKDSNNCYVVSKKINEIVDGNIVSFGDVDNYSHRILAEKIKYNVGLTDNNINSSSFMKPTTFSIQTENDVTKYFDVNEDVKGSFQINLSDTTKYPSEYLKINPIVRQVNWPQKLMNDMFVIYPDLNWETLLATDGWIDTLGEYTSANQLGGIISENNSANINAAGLVLSEFFLSIAKETELSFANYEYESIFDENTIKALMLSIMGEENYYNVSGQAKTYSKMFNYMFGSVLDDIAAERGINIVDGKVDNFTMSVYKAYMSTVMLSSEFGEYLYKVANRAFAQYTINESLAYASGDYSNYYAALNGIVDENGNAVSAFEYGSFYDLAVYENSVVGNGAPVFTFNFRKVYEYYKGEAFNKNEITLPDFTEIYNRLVADYNTVYGNGGNGKISEDDVRYCFMLEVYYKPYQQIFNRGQQKNVPKYMQLYKNYLDGNMKRWEAVSVADNKASSTKFSNYWVYEAQLNFNVIKASTLVVQLYLPNFTGQFNGTEEDMENMKEYLDNTDIDAASPYAVLANVFENSPYFNKLLNETIPNEPIGAFNIYKNIINSAKGKNDNWSDDWYGSWLAVNKFYKNLGEIIDEFGDVCSLGSTENGSRKSDVYDTDEIYDKTYNSLKKIYANVENYISTQNVLDEIDKSAITYMLSEYAGNYVPEGYVFNLENRKYTLSTYASATRIGEYVFGSDYLKKYGISAMFIEDGTAGIIDSVIAYDRYDGQVKQRLNSFSELRKFVSGIADYTASLYYMTNFNDLSDNVSDAVLLTDYVYALNNNGNNVLATPEYLILKYLINESDISADTLIDRIFGDNVNTLTNLGIYDDITYSAIVNIAKLRNGDASVINLSDSDKKRGLNDYLLFILSDKYSEFGYYNNGSTPANMRLHQAFKNVITYLVVSEDEAETIYENSIKLDYISFKDFKIMLMERLVDFVQNPNESGAENSARYLAIFNLISSGFTYSTYSDGSVIDRIGRTVYAENLTYNKAGEAVFTDNHTKNSDGELVYYNIYAKFAVDSPSKARVLELAGLDNRPIEELVNLEYNSIYSRDGNYDEANGDCFIICTFDATTSMYYPVMMRSLNDNGISNQNSNFYKYRDDLGIDIRTTYYDSQNGDPVFQPIIAKGLITSEIRPTAIRMVDGKVTFYRTNISAVANVDDDAVNVTSYVQESHTIGFTNYINMTTAKKFSNSNNFMSMFVGETTNATSVKTSGSLYFVQVTYAYDCTFDGVNAFNVLENFEHYFAFGMPELFMLFLAFATLVPLIFKIALQAMERMLDLILLTLIGPLAIAANGISSDDGKASKIFDQWKSKVLMAVLQAFGLIIGFNIYYILFTTINGMTFVSEATVQKIQAIGGITFISKGLLDALVKFVVIAVSIGIIQTSGNFVVNIISSGKVSDAFKSPINNKSTYDNMKSTVKDVKEGVKKTLTTARDIVSGKVLVEAKDAAIEAMKSALPGSAIIRKGIDVAKGIGDVVGKIKMRKTLQAHGIDKKTAKKLTDQLYEAKKAQRDAKRKRRLDNANKFTQRLGYNGENPLFEELPSFTGSGGGKGDKKDKKKKDKKKKKK